MVASAGDAPDLGSIKGKLETDVFLCLRGQEGVGGDASKQRIG